MNFYIVSDRDGTLPTAIYLADSPEHAGQRMIQQQHPRCKGADLTDIRVSICAAQHDAMLELDDPMNGEENVEGTITHFHAYDMRHQHQFLARLHIVQDHGTF